MVWHLMPHLKRDLGQYPELGALCIVNISLLIVLR